MSLTAESLLAVTGIIGDPNITSATFTRAAEVPVTFARRGAAWWETDEPKPLAPVEVADFDKLFESLNAPTNAGRLEAILRLQPEAEVFLAEYRVLLTQARQYLVERWPRVVVDTYAGPRMLPVGDDELAEIASLFAVVNRPARLLDEMDAGTLTPTQAEAFRSTYPELSRHHGESVQAAAAARTAKDITWMPTETQEIVLSILTGNPPGVVPYDSESKKPEETPKAEESTKDLGASRAETQADRTSAPKGVKHE